MRKGFFLIVALCVSLVFAEEQTVSKKELYSRARDALKTALETGNKERAEQALGYLKVNVKDGAPLIRFEEYLVNMELGDYESAILIYVDLRRTVLDFNYKPREDVRLQVDDPLAAYLHRGLIPFTKAKADSLYALVENSDVSVEHKKLYRVMLYSELMHEDLVSGEAFVAAAKDFVMYHPTSPYSDFLKNYTIPYVERNWKRERDFKEDPLKHKYYTGGLGAHVYTWRGFLSGDATDFLDDKMGDAFMVDLTMRMWRISLNAFLTYGLITVPKEGYKWDETEDESYGFTAGFTAFDSKYLRVEPFAGIGFTTYMCNDMAGESYDYVLGGNVDFRFYASKPAHIGALSVAFDLRIKYMLQLGEFDGSYDVENGMATADGVSANRHTFAIGLGVELW